MIGLNNGRALTCLVHNLFDKGEDFFFGVGFVFHDIDAFKTQVIINDHQNVLQGCLSWTGYLEYVHV